MLKIGEVVMRYRVSAKTLKRLEVQGVITPCRSASNGERRYSHQEIMKLEKYLGVRDQMVSPT